MVETFTISSTHKELLKTLLYFDVFNYPLKFSEIYSNIPITQSQEAVQQEIDALVEEGYVKKTGEFYLLNSASDDIIERRLNGNAFAQKMFPKAYSNSKKIARFPFMSGICISGGLSKNYYDDRSDIDFFVITKPNRLWICRTLFILYYKTLSIEKRKHLCLNYFISEADLTIEDTNTFVATELAYLIPTVNYSVYQSILTKNNWYKNRFRNKSELPSVNCIDTPEPFHKKMIELLFSGKFGNWVDNKLLSITLNHWRKKYPQMSDEDFHLQFRSRKHVCKRHSQGYQNKVLNLWEEKIKNYENDLQVKLN